VPLPNFVPRGLGFVHHSIAISKCQTLSITIRNFLIAVTHPGFAVDAWSDSHGADRATHYQHCNDVDYAEATSLRYMRRWVPWALQFGDVETLARAHNGGPGWSRAPKTSNYWRKVTRNKNVAFLGYVNYFGGEKKNSFLFFSKAFLRFLALLGCAAVTLRTLP
jgi:hypothetical protein